MPGSPNPTSSAQDAHSVPKSKPTPLGILDSPLEQVNSETSMQYTSKIVTLYQQLFTKDNLNVEKGFWVEFFLLPANKIELQKILRASAPLYKHSEAVQLVVAQSISILETSHAGSKKKPVKNENNELSRVSEKIEVRNALIVLEVVFTEALYQIKDHDQLIQTLVGIQDSDKKFDDLITSILMLIQHGSLEEVSPAVLFILNVARASAGTTFCSIFTSRNFFAALIRVIGSFAFNRQVSANALAAIGILSAINKYDEDNPCIYQQRISDFIDDGLMANIIILSQHELKAYISVFGESSTPSSEETKSPFGWLASIIGDKQNKPENSPLNSMYKDYNWPLMLPIYDFVCHNSVFAQLFVASPALISLIEATSLAMVLSRKTKNVNKFLKMRSHIWLGVLTLRHLIETTPQQLINTDLKSQITVRIQASKFHTGVDRSLRLPMEGIFDLVQCGLRSVGLKRSSSSSNARLTASPGTARSTTNTTSGNLDVDWKLLEQLFITVYQAFVYFENSKYILEYGWTQMFQTMCSFIKHWVVEPIDSRAEHALGLCTNLLAGIVLRRDLLPEEEWSFLFFKLVRNPKLFELTQERFPALKASSQTAFKVITSMTMQYNTDTDNPDLSAILKQAVFVAGGDPNILIGEKMLPFSEQKSDSELRRIIKLEVR